MSGANHEPGGDTPHRPFGVLLASRPPSERGKGARWGAVSLVVHAAIGTGLVLGTMAMAEQPEVEEEPIYIELVEEVEPPPPPPTPVEPIAPVDVEEALKGFQTLAVPTVVPLDIPPPSIHSSFSEADFTGEGVEGGRADGREATDSTPVEDAPTFTPFTVAPSLRNNDEVVRALMRNYPPLLRDAGIGGTVVVWLFVDAEGTVVKTQVHTGSGYAAFDEAALQVGEAMRFRPAQNRDVKVPVWVSLPITFEVQQ